MGCGAASLHRFRQRLSLDRRPRRVRRATPCRRDGPSCGLSGRGMGARRSVRPLAETVDQGELAEVLGADPVEAYRFAVESPTPWWRPGVWVAPSVTTPEMEWFRMGCRPGLHRRCAHTGGHRCVGQRPPPGARRPFPHSDRPRLPWPRLWGSMDPWRWWQSIACGRGVAEQEPDQQGGPDHCRFLHRGRHGGPSSIGKPSTSSTLPSRPCWRSEPLTSTPSRRLQWVSGRWWPARAAPSRCPNG